MAKTHILHYVIYDSPSDYPGEYVVRCWSIGRYGMLVPHGCYTAATLDGARRHVPRGMVRITRQPEDDPVIVETWL